MVTTEVTKLELSPFSNLNVILSIAKDLLALGTAIQPPWMLRSKRLLACVAPQEYFLPLVGALRSAFQSLSLLQDDARGWLCW